MSIESVGEVGSSSRPNAGAGSFWPASSSGFPYRFALFGRFQAAHPEGSWPQFESRKLQQLMAYLLLYRERPHHRDALSSLLWPDSSPKQSRKNLRQSLWHLQRSAIAHSGEPALLFIREKDWIRVNLSNVWLDVAELEVAFEMARALPLELMNEAAAEAAMNAAGLYRADLLEGWEERWCVHERERLKLIHMALLERLVAFCEASNRLEAGFAYANLLLKHDPAHERAHWRVMRLHHLAGDRTSALRQFEKCRAALSQEFGVGPGRLTRSLYDEIRNSG